ncbi:MAG: hypothetical protein ACTS8R_08720 [Arsenophonus sp. NC-QC1-MAG3]
MAGLSTDVKTRHRNAYLLQQTMQMNIDDVKIKVHKVKNHSRNKIPSRTCYYLNLKRIKKRGVVVTMVVALNHLHR